MSEIGYSVDPKTGRRRWEKPVVYPTPGEVDAILATDLSFHGERPEALAHAVNTALRTTRALYTKLMAVGRIFALLPGSYLQDPLRNEYWREKSQWRNTLRLLADGRRHPRTLKRLDAMLRSLSAAVSGTSPSLVESNLRYWAEKPPEHRAVNARKRRKDGR